MTVNGRILRRLLAELDRFDSGASSLPELQCVILGHGLAAELGQRWQDLVNGVEGAIEMARFAMEPARQIAAVRPHLDSLRAAATKALQAEPDDSEHDEPQP